MGSWFTQISALAVGRNVRFRMAIVALVLFAMVISTIRVLDGRAAGATPLHVWLHYDYLVGAPDGHSDAPDSAAIQLVVDAYARHGITLEIDNRHNEIPWKPYVGLVGNCGFSDTIALPEVKAQYFHPTANHEWHYALFGDRLNPACEGLSGVGEAELYGDNFVIAMSVINHFGGGLYVLGGAFMHELGHNLGLQHGGFEETNYKPN